MGALKQLSSVLEKMMIFFMKFDMMQLGVLLYKSCDLMFILILENRAKIGTWAVSKPIILNLKLKLRRDS